MDENPYEGTSENENRRPRELHEKEIEVVGVWEARAEDTESAGDAPIRETFVKLRDRRGRELPIFIGAFEAMSILQALSGKTAERPLSHDLVRIAIEKMGGRIERIIIDDLWQSTFYARIFVARDGAETLEIDARPSDAIALGVRTGTPIFVAESVLQEAGHADEAP